MSFRPSTAHSECEIFPGQGGFSVAMGTNVAARHELVIGKTDSPLSKKP